MRNIIQGLVVKSYDKEQLDPVTVDLIANRLSRKELKHYINLLKKQENKKHVVVSVPKELSAEERTMIQKLFINKTIVYSVDPTMISGIRIVDNDVEYEISLDQIFNNLLTHITKYD